MKVSVSGLMVFSIKYIHWHWKPNTFILVSILLAAIQNQDRKHVSLVENMYAYWRRALNQRYQRLVASIGLRNLWIIS